MKKWLPVVTVVLIGVIAAPQFEKSDPDTKVIAFATLMLHPALDAVQESLMKELEREGMIEGENIRYVIRNAHGDVRLAASIAHVLVSQEPDVIVAVTTPMAQAVVKTARCPVVFAAVTDPVGAGLVKSVSQGEETATGTSDAWPYEDQLKLIRQISPNAKQLGVLYNPGEAASQYGIQEIRRFAPGLGFELVEGSVSSTREVHPITQDLAGRVDALFLSSDNTVIGGVAAVVKVAAEHKIPLYAGDSGTVEKGAVAAVSVSYAELGTETGRLVVRILNGEKNIPTVVAKGSDVYVNKKAAELMGVTLQRRFSGTPPKCTKR